MNLEKIKNILRRKAMYEGKRELTINIAEIARELNCSQNEAKRLLDYLYNSNEIKRPIGLSGDEYLVTIRESSSILQNI